jgi:hypothetical protein
MRYLLLICVDEELAAIRPDVPRDPQPWIDECGPRRLEGHQLRGPADATLVRDGGTLVTDGPFAETKEQIAGYDVLEADSLDEVVALVAKHPVAQFGAIEIRPLRA